MSERHVSRVTEARERDGDWSKFTIMLEHLHLELVIFVSSYNIFYSFQKVLYYCKKYIYNFILIIRNFKN